MECFQIESDVTPEVLNLNRVLCLCVPVETNEELKTSNFE